MPDVIDGITIFPNGFLATIFGRLIRRFSVVHPGGTDIYEEPAWFRRAIVGPVLKHCNLVVAKTRHMRKQAQTLTQGEANIVVIPNGVDVSAYRVDRHACRCKLSVPENQMVILFVGRYVKIKGIEHLLNAMPRILEMQNVHLLLVGEDLGEGRRLSELANRLHIQKDVTFVGRVDHAQVSSYMLASDIFVLPSLSEGFPLVILEAMAAGLPIVASNVTGIREIVRDGENGYLVIPGDSGDISNKILLLLRSPETRRSMQATNLKAAEAYSWRKVGATLLTTVLQDLHYHDK
jgi:glycosyltransferase involved in cell wall biosynthesis